MSQPSEAFRTPFVETPESVLMSLPAAYDDTVAAVEIAPASAAPAQYESTTHVEDVDTSDFHARGDVPSRVARFLGRHGVDLSLLAAASSTYLWEQSPENERFRGKWGVRALTEAHEHFIDGAIDPRWLAVGKAAVAAMAVVGGITMAVETGVGLLTSATLTRKEGMLGWFNRGITKVAEVTLGNTKKLNGKPKGEIALAIAGGSAPVVVTRNALAGDEGRSFKENATTAVKTAAGITAFSAAVTGATVAVVETADLHGHTEGALELLDRVQDSKTWWALYGGILAWTGVKGAALMAAQRIGTLWHNRPSELEEASYYDIDGLDRIIETQRLDEARLAAAEVAA